MCEALLVMNASFSSSSRVRRRNSRTNVRTKLEIYFKRPIRGNSPNVQFLIGVSLSLGFVYILTRRWQHIVERDHKVSAPTKWKSDLFPDFPTDYIDIWPDHQSELLQSSVLQNHCTPNLYDGCVARKSINNSQETHVILLRSPGVFGRLLDDFFSAFVKTLGDGGKNIHTTHSVIPDESHIHNDKISKGTRVLIRLAVLPPALEAMDLAITLSNNNVNTSSLHFSENDLTEALRLWTAWHCNISAVAQGTNKENVDIPLLTVPLDQLLAYPMKAEKQLADFLGIDLPPEEKRKHVPMERRISRALNRIDDCYNLSLSLSVSNAPEVPDCASVLSSNSRLRKPAAHWVSLTRRLLVEGESHNSVCRTQKDQLFLCERPSPTQ